RLNDVGLPDPFVGSGNSWQLVIAKYSQAGQYIKAVRYVPFTRVIPGAVAYDKNGNIGVIGQSVQNPGQIWIGMFDANLDIMPGWPRALGGTAQAQLSGFTGLNGRAQITFDAAGNLIASGEYQGTASFAKFEGAATNDTTVFTSVDAAQQPTTCCGALDVFVVKLAPNGFVTWARSFGASGGDRNNSLAIDGAGDVILTTAGEARVRKLSGATGDALWSRAIPNDNSSAVPDPTTGDVFVTGAIRQFAFDFGGTSLIAPSGADVYLARYAAATGALQWAKSANSAHTPPGFTYAIGGYLAIGDHGLVVGGEMLDQFNGRIDFGSGWFPTYASNDLFLAGYDFDGTFQWAKHVSLVLDGHFSSMQVVADRLAMSGTFSGSMYVDDRLLPNAIPELTHYSNAFVASFKLPQPGDVLPPLVDNLSQPIVVQATSSGGAKVWFMAPTAIDTGYAGTSVVCDPPPNSLFSVGITIVTCTATDPFGNATVATFPITVKDNYGPTFTGVVPITVQSPSGTAVIVNYALPVATDQVSGPATVSCSPPPGTAFPVGTTEVTCYAIDNAGNRSTVTFPVTVESPLDVMPPLIVAPADYTVEATSSGGAVVTYPVTATDDGGPVTIVCTPPLGSTLPLGTTTVTCTATDAAGNSSTLSFNVTVEDHSAPTLYAPTDPVVVSASAGGTVVTYSVSATDTVDSSVTTVCTPPSGSTFSLGTTSVTCTATDDAGNTTTKTFLVRVVAEWTGILQPINADGSSVFKLGNVVPVKFKLGGSSAGIATLTATLTLVKVSSSPTGTDIEAISVGSADSGNTFRYDPVNDIYIFNLATTTLSVGTWQLRIDLGDGVIHTVNISLKK
ncbi:MAG TPA: HYR domain-containing protein, partial [Kofleriaceae bacterium]